MRHSALEIQVPAWDRHTNVTWISNANTDKQTITILHFLILLHSKKPRTITQMNDNINMASTIVGSENDNINMASTLVGSENDNINMDSTIAVFNE